MSGKGGPSAEAQFLFKSMKSTPENEICFECDRQNPDWASIPNGLLICRDCAGKHRSLGTHLSFVRSINMDSWTDLQLASMRFGGNANAHAFFSRYGIADIPNLTNKYGTSAAQAYREKLIALSTGQPWRDPTKEELKKFRAYSRPTESMFRDTDQAAFDKFLNPAQKKVTTSVQSKPPMNNNVQKPKTLEDDDDFFNFSTTTTNDNSQKSTSSTTTPTTTQKQGNYASHASPTTTKKPLGSAGRGRGRGVKKPTTPKVEITLKPKEEVIVQLTAEEEEDIWGFSTDGIDNTSNNNNNNNNNNSEVVENVSIEKGNNDEVKAENEKVAEVKVGLEESNSDKTNTEIKKVEEEKEEEMKEDKNGEEKVNECAIIINEGNVIQIEG